MAHFGGTPQRPWGEPLHPPLHQITTELDPELVRAWAEPSGSNPEVRADVVAFFKQMNATDTLAAAQKLREFDGPSMVMWSRHDRPQTFSSLVGCAVILGEIQAGENCRVERICRRAVN